MEYPIEKLANDKIISPEILARLKSAWISNTDELYARIIACEDSNDKRMKKSMAREIGVQPKDLVDFKTRILPYVSQEVLKAKKPEKHPTGYRI